MGEQLYVTLWGDAAPLPPDAVKPVAVQLTRDEKAALARIQASNREKARRAAGNPCVATFGKVPAGRTCETCRHLIVKTFDKRYWKCELRGNTDGSATDHRVRWPACGRFEERS